MTVPTGSRPRLPARPAIWVYSPLNKFLHTIALFMTVTLTNLSSP